MKLAVAGKGGVGKTSISGTLARVFARDGYRVLAVDNDMNPNLSLTLGIPPERMTALPTFGPEGVRRGKDGDYGLAMTLDEIRAAYSLPGPEEITLLVAGQPTEAATGCFGPMYAAVRCVVEVAEDSAKDVCILDTEASTEHLLVSTAKHEDAMFAVVEPYYTSLETGRRIVMLAEDLGLPRVAIANKVRGEEDVAVVEAFGREHDIEVVGLVPYDYCFHEAERVPCSPFDHAPGAAAMRAIADLAPRLPSGPRATSSPSASPSACSCGTPGR